MWYLDSENKCYSCTGYYLSELIVWCVQRTIVNKLFQLLTECNLLKGLNDN